MLVYFCCFFSCLFYLFFCFCSCAVVGEGATDQRQLLCIVLFRITGSRTAALFTRDYVQLHACFSIFTANVWPSAHVFRFFLHPVELGCILIFLADSAYFISRCRIKLLHSYDSNILPCIILLFLQQIEINLPCAEKHAFYIGCFYVTIIDNLLKLTFSKIFQLTHHLRMSQQTLWCKYD